MRFVLVSTHVDQTTGYSKVSHALLKQLATVSPKVKTFHFGFQRHPSRAGIRKVPNGVTPYDAAANEDPKEEGFGFNKIHEYLEMVNPDIVMIYNDPVTICRFIEAMKYEPGKSPYRLWIYLDQVYEGAAPQVIDIIRRSAERIYCFTESWKRVFLGYGQASDVRILEHAVDSTVLSSLPPDSRHAIRTSVNLPGNAIVLLNANRNSQRKRLDLTIQGFVRALAKNPRLYLMVATNMNPQSGAYYDVQRIYLEELKLNGLECYPSMRNLILVDTAAPNIVDDDGVNQMYNLADIGINTSDGEGFGLCQLEHLYTGAPQVVTGLETYRTFLNDSVAAFVPPTGRGYFAGGMPHGLWYPTFDPADVAKQIEHVVANLDTMRAAVKTHSFKTWSTICDELLEDLLMLSGGQEAIVSVPAMLTLPSA
jgi:glycosyltransferase involved in cell wall biosynthesis